MTPTVSAIVLFHDSRTAREAISCIKALRQQSNIGTIEIIVVNNNTTNDVLQEFQNNISDLDSLRVVHTSHNLGYGAGNNFGANYASGEYILVINPDTLLNKDALGIMLQHIKEHPDVGIIGPQLVFPDGSVRDSYRIFPRISDSIIKRTFLRHVFKRRMRSYLQWNTDPNIPQDSDWISGACFLIKRSLYEKLQGFDERFFLFFEDTDICRRIWKHGKRVVYFPEAKARDRKERLSDGGALSFFIKKTVQIHVVSAIKYFWKWRWQKTSTSQEQT